MLMSLTQRINQTQLQEKDLDAENLLGRELGANSDATYILAQTVLVQDIALQQAKAQVTQLQQQVQQAQQQPAHATSFLGGLFGRHDSQPQPAQPPQQMQTAPQIPPGQAPPYQPVPQYQQPQYQQPGQPQYYPPPQPQYGAPAPFGGAVPMGQPSFLRGAMQTAAGVAAGALAFEGVESILHGFGHGGGYGGGFGGFGGGGMAGMGMGPGMGMGGAFERPVEETVVNNYYDAPGAGGASGAGGGLGAGGVAGGLMGAGEHNFSEAGKDQNFRQSEDQGGYQLSDAKYEAQGNDNVGSGDYDQSMADDSAAYDTSADNVQVDDGGGFDDGGSGFDSGGDNS